MRTLVSLAAALCFLLAPAAFAAPPDHKPAAASMPMAAHAKPTVRHSHTWHRPAMHRPYTGWHRPTADRWYWRGHWVNRVRAPVFRYPHGWGYRHWYVGARLPAVFLIADYFYDDFLALGLESPPPGYRWVRYGPDLLLVNLRTGVVEQVAYGVFY